MYLRSDVGNNIGSEFKILSRFLRLSVHHFIQYGDSTFIRSSFHSILRFLLLSGHHSFNAENHHSFSNISRFQATLKMSITFTAEWFSWKNLSKTRSPRVHDSTTFCSTFQFDLLAGFVYFSFGVWTPKFHMWNVCSCCGIKTQWNVKFEKFSFLLLI